MVLVYQLVYGFMGLCKGRCINMMVMCNDKIIQNMVEEDQHGF